MPDHRNRIACRAPALLLCTGLGACGDDASVVASAPEPQTPTEAAGPFKSLAPAANAPDAFSQPRAGVPLASGDVAFVAIDESSRDDDVSSLGPHAAVFLQPAPAADGSRGAPRLLYAGDELVSPLDIDASADGRTLLVADYAGGAEGAGAILRVSTTGEARSFAADGWSPRSITLGPDGTSYFSGVEPESGQPGVFRLRGDGVEPLFVGPPLVDPSGIAVFRDGRVLVADTRLLDGAALLADVTASEAGVVLIENGAASVFATGFATGFPAGIALTLDERTLIISGQGPDRRDSVYLVNVAAPRELPAVVTDVFSEERDSSAGLKRAHDSNVFIWSSLSFAGGTVFRIEG